MAKIYREATRLYTKVKKHGEFVLLISIPEPGECMRVDYKRCIASPRRPMMNSNSGGYFGS